MTLWLVRGGRYGEQEAMALRENAAIVGWDALGDLSGIRDRSELTTLLAITYPDEGARTRSNWKSQIWPFLQGFRAGDLIVMPLKTRPSIMVGQIGPEGYRFRTDLPDDMRQTHAVSWRHELPRAAFDQDLLYSFGAFMTVCSVHRNDAESRVRAMLEGAPDPGMAEPRAGEEAQAEQAVAEPAALDLEQLARDQIRRLIARRFAGHQLTALIAALLDAEGYTTRQSPEGPDGGIDIVAGRGPLGFDAPRLAVQVKSGDTPSDIRMVRESQGVLRKFGADHGLFVSWAGFRGTVDREITRDFFGMRLWTSDDVIRAIEEHYERLPPVIQAELPLRRLWAVTELN